MKKAAIFPFRLGLTEVALGAGVPIIPRLKFIGHLNSIHKEDDTQFSTYLSRKAWCLN